MKYIYLFIIISCFACQERNKKLETALKLAGNNRDELEKVLHHYSWNKADSLKLKAAKFLIENMPGHYTLDGQLINEYRKNIFADTTGSYFAKKVLDIYLCQIPAIKNVSQKKEDVRYIKADYLIRHIDATYELVEKYFWLKNIPFDIFSEHFLPYRFDNERPDLWRDSLHVDPNILSALKYKDNEKFSISKVNIDLVFLESQKFPSSNLIKKIFKNEDFLDCYYLSLKEWFKNVALGIPTTIDYLPHYPNKNGYHYWSSIVSPELKIPAYMSTLERKASKILRRTFARNLTITADKNEYIPDLFKDPFNKDVTSTYIHTADITVSKNKKVQTIPRHAYLCVFNNLAWQPIATSDFKNNNVQFNDMGKDIVYLPVYYKGNKMKSLNYPFILHLDGTTKYLEPDTCTKQKLHLTRKFPFNKKLFFYNEQLKEMKIEASNQPSFREVDTLLHNLTSAITYSFGIIKSKKTYQFWRITHPSQITFAEFICFDSRGKIIKGNVNPIYDQGFDNNPLTNTTFYSENKEIIIDWGGPVEISKVISLPRSDSNGIYPNNEYELFYYDLNGWRSLGRQIAKDYYIEYDTVPCNALFWLHNHTTGIEDRVFTHENKEIRFW